MGSDATDDIWRRIKEKFIEVRKLRNNHEKSSLETEPYKYKYDTINFLKEIKVEVSNLENKNKDTDAILAILHLNQGILHVDTEELKMGEEQLMKCLDLLKGREEEPETVLSVLCALNLLGILWSQWNQPTKAKAFLDQAVHIYKNFTDKNNFCQGTDNMTVHFSIVDIKEDLTPKETLEKLHTLTLYYLAQVYGSLKDHHKSGMYCHMTLRGQLYDIMQTGGVTQDVDYVEWALNTATLSQYFMEKNSYLQARHHLAAASFILQKYEVMLKEKGDPSESEELAAEWEKYKHRSADVARCWAKYGILLLSLSRQRLLQKADSDEQGDSSESEDNSRSKTEKELKDCLEDLKFEILEREIEPLVNQITDKHLLDFNDARPVFLHVQKMLEEAKTYYTLENHASDHVQIIQDMSQAYKYLSFFEDNEDRQAKMHKRRVDILEGVINELNPQYYKVACRQIWMELGETYYDILDIKYERLRSTDEKPPIRALNKVNHLIKCAMKNFQAFLDSLGQLNSTDKISEDVMQPALSAYFYLGRLYYKFITHDKTLQLKNFQNSVNAYQFVIDYCEKNPKAAEVMKTELNLCKELVNLFSIKITNLKQEMMD